MRSNTLLLRICMFTCIVSHVACLTYQSINDPGAKVAQGGLKYYFFFQCTFDLLNIALIAHMFQWVDIFITLDYVLNIAESGLDDDLSRSSEHAAIINSRVSIKESI